MGKKQFHLRRHFASGPRTPRGVTQLALDLREGVKADTFMRLQEPHNGDNVLLFAPKDSRAQELSPVSRMPGEEQQPVRPSAGAQRPQPRKRELLTACELRRTPDGVCVRTAGRVIARRAPATAHDSLWLSIEDKTGISSIAVPAALHDGKRALFEAGTYLEIEGRLRNSKGTLHIEASRVAAPAQCIPRSFDVSR